VVREYAEKFQLEILVETGTFMGEMIDAVLDEFREIHSIELGSDLCEKARQRFAGAAHIHIHHGDSAQVLPEILRRLREPALFWLDGHYSKGITAKGQKNTPILEELEAIYQHEVKEHVILIDDARLFDGSRDYPRLEELRQLVNKWSPGAGMESRDDIIRLCPAPLPCR
jgi:hypothetical protein